MIIVAVVIVWYLDLQLPVQLVPSVMSSNPVYGEVYSIQQYVIQFVSNFRQVGGFLLVLRFSPPIQHNIFSISSNTLYIFHQ